MNRRRLLTKIVQGFSLTGLAFLSYPFVRFLLPNFGEELNLHIAVGGMRPGETKTVFWQGRSLVVIKRPDKVIESLAHGDLTLKDPDSSQSIQPDFARNVYRSRRADIFVSYTNCTHLGCEVAVSDKKGVGFTCPCHQSDYDHAGRVMEGAAALFNLEIPQYRFLSRNLIQLEKGGFEHTG